MSRLIIIPMLVVFAAFASLAQETIVITEAECRLLVRHVPAADVAYEPGVDVYGNAVAPADVGAPKITLPEEISIDVTALVYELLQTTPPPGLEDTAIDLGKVVLRDGQLTYNGQRLGDTADAALVAACQTRGF